MSYALFVLAGMLVGFVLGVLFHKFALDGEQRLKQHMTDEVNATRRFFIAEGEALRRDLAAGVEAARSKL